MIFSTKRILHCFRCNDVAFADTTLQPIKCYYCPYDCSDEDPDPNQYCLSYDHCATIAWQSNGQAHLQRACFSCDSLPLPKSLFLEYYCKDCIGPMCNTHHISSLIPGMPILHHLIKSGMPKYWAGDWPGDEDEKDVTWKGGYRLCHKCRDCNQVPEIRTQKTECVSNHHVCSVSITVTNVWRGFAPQIQRSCDRCATVFQYESKLLQCRECKDHYCNNALVPVMMGGHFQCYNCSGQDCYINGNLTQNNTCYNKNGCSVIIKERFAADPFTLEQIVERRCQRCGYSSTDLYVNCRDCTAELCNDDSLLATIPEIKCHTTTDKDLTKWCVSHGRCASIAWKNSQNSTNITIKRGCMQCSTKDKYGFQDYGQWRDCIDCATDFCNVHETNNFTLVKMRTPIIEYKPEDYYLKTDRSSFGQQTFILLHVNFLLLLLLLLFV